MSGKRRRTTKDTKSTKSNQSRTRIRNLTCLRKLTLDCQQVAEVDRCLGIVLVDLERAPKALLRLVQAAATTEEIPQVVVKVRLLRVQIEESRVKLLRHSDLPGRFCFLSATLKGTRGDFLVAHRLCQRIAIDNLRLQLVGSFRRGEGRFTIAAQAVESGECGLNGAGLGLELRGALQVYQSLLQLSGPELDPPQRELGDGHVALLLENLPVRRLRRIDSIELLLKGGLQEENGRRAWGEGLRSTRELEGRDRIAMLLERRLVVEPAIAHPTDADYAQRNLLFLQRSQGGFVEVGAEPGNAIATPGVGRGDGERVDAVEVRWPRGHVEERTNLPLNSYVTLVEQR